MNQKVQAILGESASIFGKHRGKFRRDVPLEPGGVNCAVLA
ncbi:hypothetical protein [Allofournierella massiliensis]